MTGQLVLPGVPETVRGNALAGAVAFVAANRRRYRAMARAILPDLGSRPAVWQRLAWAVLTANATYESTIEALQRCRWFDWGAEALPPHVFSGIPGMVPAKVDYLNALRRDVRWYLRDGEEPWDAYRVRLWGDTQGLALTKASYAVCMLYPLESDVACLDTWIQKVFSWTTAFRSLSLDEYRAMEAEVRAIARPAGVSTALCQWMLWDYARGTTTDQRVFS